MTLKNKGHLFYATSSFVHHFKAISELHQPWLWFITGGYLVKRWFLPAAARARGQSNDLNRGILASNLFNCCKEVINAPPVPSISRCIHIVYRQKNVSDYQRSNFIYNRMSTFLYYVHCKDALLHCSAPGGERCESLTRVDEIQTGIAVWKCSTWVKISLFLSCVTLKFDRWPWTTIGHLFCATSSFVHHFVTISKYKLELWSGNTQIGTKFVLNSVTLTLTFDLELLHGHPSYQW